MGVFFLLHGNAWWAHRALRGRAVVNRARCGAIIVAPRGRHSAKPHVVRETIVRICGDVPRVELFARTKSPGWDIWGNELVNDIELSGVGILHRVVRDCLIASDAQTDAGQSVS